MCARANEFTALQFTHHMEAEWSTELKENELMMLMLLLPMTINMFTKVSRTKQIVSVQNRLHAWGEIRVSIYFKLTGADSDTSQFTFPFHATAKLYDERIRINTWRSSVGYPPPTQTKNDIPLELWVSERSFDFRDVDTTRPERSFSCLSRSRRRSRESKNSLLTPPRLDGVSTRRSRYGLKRGGNVKTKSRWIPFFRLSISLGELHGRLWALLSFSFSQFVQSEQWALRLFEFKLLFCND